MIKTRSTVAAVKRAEVSRVVATTQAKLVGPKKEAPLHITMRNFNQHDRIKAFVTSIKAEGDDLAIGDAVVDLLRVVRALSYRLFPRHRARVAMMMHETEVELRQSVIRIVHQEPIDPIMVTRYPTDTNESASL